MQNKNKKEAKPPPVCVSCSCSGEVVGLFPYLCPGACCLVIRRGYKDGKKDTSDTVAFTNFGKRFFIYIQAVSQCHSCFPFFLFFQLNVITKRICSLQIYSVIMYTIISLLVTLWQQCKQRERALPTLHKHMQGVRQTCPQYVRV